MLKPQISFVFGSNTDESKIIELLQSGIRDGDELQILSKLPADKFSIINDYYGIIGHCSGTWRKSMDNTIKNNYKNSD